MVSGEASERKNNIALVNCYHGIIPIFTALRHHMLTRLVKRLPTHQRPVSVPAYKLVL